MNAPVIFLSAASDDLGNCRDVLHKAFERAGCKVHTQKQSFSASAGDVLDLLSQHLDKSDFVIHLAGLAYGSEPKQPAFPTHPGFACSYTQFEYYYAHQRGKKVIAFVCAPDFPYQPFTQAGADDADRERRRQLQLAHRERVTKGSFTGTPLEGHPHRPLSEPVADANALLAAVAAAVGTIRDHAPALTALAAVQQELASLKSLHQLPPPPAGFVGRAADLAELRQRRSAGAENLFGLRGMGGIGKTALALVLANEWAADFPDAQLVLDGRGTQPSAPSAADLLAEAIHAFHPTAKLPEAEKELQKIYAQTLAGKRVLVLLDNAKDAAQAKPLLPPPGCCLLVTSRHNFLIGNVTPHRVGDLPAPESIALLQSLCPTLTEADAAAVARRCAYLPLALRLAGTHLALDASDRGTPDAAGYLAQLNSGRLATLDADAPDAGEVTISETLRLSESALDQRLRDTWRKLAVFPASFDNAAALAIAAATPQMLQQLLRRSLIEAEGPRHHLHDLAAEYAARRLTPEEFTGLRLAHAGHYRSVLAECSRQYLAGGPSVMDGLALFDAERSQIESAHAWLLDAAGATSSLRRECDELLVGYGDVGVYFLDLRLHPRERIAWLEAALAAARRQKDRAAEGRNIGNLGVAWASIADARGAVVNFEQALIIAREMGDRRSEGHTLGNLGLAWEALGDARKAIAFHEQALVIHRDTHDRRGEGADLGNLGNGWATLDDARKAIAYYEQQLTIVREIGDRRGEGNALGNLGNSWAVLDDARRAIGYYEQQLIIASEIGDRHGECAANGNLGVAWRRLGNASKAIAYQEQCLSIAGDIGDRRGEGSALGNLGNAWADLGDTRKAIGCYERQLAVVRDIGDRRNEGIAFGNLGVAWAALGHVRKAIEYHGQRLAVARETGDRRGEAMALFNSADELAKAGESAAALSRAEQAAEIFAAIESPHAEQARQLAEAARARIGRG